MSLVPLQTASSPGNYLFATTSQLDAITASISTVSISTATGAGVSVAEPIPNRFIFTNALSNAGGLSFVSVPGSSTLGLSNAGVLSVTAGSNITITGTAGAPVINAAAGLNISQTNLQPAGLPNVSVTGPNAAASVTIPVLGDVTIPTVAGGLYAINGGMLLQTTSDAYEVELLINSSGNEVALAQYSSSYFNVGGSLRNAALTFSGFVIASGTGITLVLRNGGAAGLGDNSSANFTPLYITRIA